MYHSYVPSFSFTCDHFRNHCCAMFDRFILWASENGPKLSQGAAVLLDFMSAREFEGWGEGEWGGGLLVARSFFTPAWSSDSFLFFNFRPFFLPPLQIKDGCCMFRDQDAYTFLLFFCEQTDHLANQFYTRFVQTAFRRWIMLVKSDKCAFVLPLRSSEKLSSERFKGRNWESGDVFTATFCFVLPKVASACLTPPVTDLQAVC